MVDELFELVLGEKGFVVEVRCDDSFNDAKYNRIKEILIALITDWKQNEYIPKKAMLTIVELMICLVGGNRFLSKDEALKLEDASIEIECLLNNLYENL